ncbi:TPA: ATP-binding protein, partial [Candidatus Bathyarchaeota archaeon]|nr:ATP-binding protein [Candidatus Bathyarchaeota archaeon]
YTPSGGKIRVATGKKQSYLYVAVQDTGTGIKKQDLERIFEPFQRIEKPTGVESHPLERKEEEGHEGTGLGLTIVKRIVEAHGGHVEVESKINQGSKFSFFLPLRKR